MLSLITMNNDSLGFIDVLYIRPLLFWFELLQILSIWRIIERCEWCSMLIAERWPIVVSWTLFGFKWDYFCFVWLDGVKGNLRSCTYISNYAIIFVRCMHCLTRSCVITFFECDFQFFTLHSINRYCEAVWHVFYITLIFLTDWWPGKR